MTDDAVASPEPGATTAHKIDRVRELLARPKPKSPEWQDETGRLISMLALGFAQEPDESSALTIVALVGQATARGVKAAKLRDLRLVRWVEAAPPSLSVLGSVDEKRAGIAALSKLKAPWWRGYTEAALDNVDVPAALIPHIARWGLGVERDWPAYLGGSYASAVAAAPDLARAAALLKEAPKLMRFAEYKRPASVAEALHRLLEAATQITKQHEGGGKAVAAVLKRTFDVVEIAGHGLPALLLQPAYVSAHGQLTAALNAGKRSAPANLGTASSATISLLVDSVARFGKGAVELLRPLIAIWSSTYPGFSKQLREAVALEPGLSGLLAGQGEPEEQINQDDRYATEGAFATVLPAWDAFVGQLPDPTTADSLGLMLRDAAASVGVERFGEVGALTLFDPLAHHLAGGQQVPPLRVSVARAGVLVRRADGTERILLKALVRPA